jgi:hypothetical protein
VTADFEELPARPQSDLLRNPFHQWTAPNGDLVAMFYRLPEGYLLRFPGRADFILAAPDRSISCIPTPQASRNALLALYQNQVSPLLRSLNGALVLHGSAASGPPGALAFLGQSGRGKSTLAAAFARAGHPFLTDDGVWLERASDGFLVAPRSPGIRLWPDSELAVLDIAAHDRPGIWAEKSHLAPGPALPHRDEPQRLRSIYLLGEGQGSGIVLEPLASAAALVELIKHAFILDVEDRAAHLAHFERLAGLAETVPCFALDFPRRYEELPSVVEAILAHAAQGVAAT